LKATTRRRAVPLWIYFASALLIPTKGNAQEAASMVSIPAGPFLMGSPAGHGGSDEHPQHKVYLSAYSIDDSEITLEEFVRFLNSLERSEDAGLFMRFPNIWVTKTPLGFALKEAAQPGEAAFDVTFDGATKYCESVGKRLPTEAEWEKACRAGSQADFSFGNDSNRLGEFAWFSGNSKRIPHQGVRTKKSNAWGIYDMHGGVWEMVSDWYSSDFYQRSPKDNPESPFPTGAQSKRVIRGGSRRSDPGTMRCAARAWRHAPAEIDVGFRCAKSEPK
jgi:formylglycine-generating enzyme required for sulfatase activity